MIAAVIFDLDGNLLDSEGVGLGAEGDVGVGDPAHRASIGGRALR